MRTEKNIILRKPILINAFLLLVDKRISRVFSPIQERADNLSLMKKTLFLDSFYEITKL